MDTTTRLLRRARAWIRQGAAARPEARPVLRDELIPDAGEFPAARQIILVGGIPRHYAGRTASILTKTRLWYEAAGVATTVVTTQSSAELDDLSHHFRAKGALAAGVRLVSLLDFYPDTSPTTAESITHPVMEPGLRAIRDADQSVYRFFDEHGVYRLFKRFDYQGRLIVRDFFHETRGRTQRDEFRTDGTLKRSVFFDLHTNQRRQDIYYSRCGVPLFNHWTAPSAVKPELVTQRVTYFDAAGTPTRVGASYEPILHACLDQLVGEEPAILSVEARGIDEMVLNYRRTHVKRVFVLHNAHISEPYDDVHRIRTSYRPLLDRSEEADAIVFLTRTQRAEAEQHYGQQANFRVIPHSAQAPPSDTTTERRLHKVIMMARLDHQKQIDHAIEAFRAVVDAVPTATLEIYGRGQLRQSLSTQIARLGLADSVHLKGYTTDVHMAYRSAGICIMTSRFEGAPLTVVESLMHGCPVISYDLKYGPADIITNGRNGFLVPYNSISGMAKQVVAVLTDPALHLRLIDNANLTTDSFTEDAFLRRWASLFDDLIKTP